MSPALAEQVVKEGGDRLGGVHLTVSTLFADIRNFTPMSEGMDAAEVVGMLNEYFSYMVWCLCLLFYSSLETLLVAAHFT